MHLTRGDLPVERRAEVSRSHSSDEGRESGWSEGQKAQETGWQPDSVAIPSCLKGRPETAAGEDRPVDSGWRTDRGRQGMG